MGYWSAGQGLAWDLGEQQVDLSDAGSHENGKAAVGLKTLDVRLKNFTEGSSSQYTHCRPKTARLFYIAPQDGVLTLFMTPS